MPSRIETLDLSGAASGFSAVPPPLWADYERVVRERRAGRGWSGEEIRRRLAHPAWRAVAGLLRGESEGLLLLTAGAAPDAETSAALSLVEPRPRSALAPLRFRLDVQGARAQSGAGPRWSPRPSLACAVLATPPAAPRALADAVATVAALAAGWERKLHPVLVEFGFGDPGPRAAFANALATARSGGDTVQSLRLYSPLFYAHGMLRAPALLAAILDRSASPPLIAIPGLGDWSAALASGGADWTGVLLGGGEKPIAWLPAAASAEQKNLTLQALEILTG